MSSGSEGKKLDKCAQDFIKNNTKTLSSGSSEKSETSESETSENTESSTTTTETSGTSGTTSGPSGSLWAEIEKLNQKFLDDLKALLPSAMSSEPETSESSETTTQSS